MIGQAPDPFWQVAPWIWLAVSPFALLLLLGTLGIVSLRETRIDFARRELNMTWLGVILILVLLILGSPLIAMVFGLKNVAMIIVFTMVAVIYVKIRGDQKTPPLARP